MSDSELRWSDSVLRCSGLAKSFGSGEVQVDVLRDLELEVARGESVAIVGASGCGKSTLLHLLAGLDRPDAGTVEIGGHRIDGLADSEQAQLRNRSLGFVYQMHHLLPEFSALENVTMPPLIGGMSVEQACEKAAELLERVDMGGRLQHRPGELSGGERQRVAVCRALVMDPDVVLADEPTGNLDPHTAHEVFDLMKQLNAERGIALVLVTHDEALAKTMQTGYRLSEGRVVREW